MDRLKALSIHEERDQGFTLEDDNEERENEWEYSLVGRFLTDRSINFIAMKQTLASIWKPSEGLTVTSVNPNLFLFRFFHEADMQKVINNSPWTFDNHLFIFKRLAVTDQPQRVLLFEVFLWVQVSDVPIGLWSEKVRQAVGNYIGRFLDTDVNNFSGQWREYMRVRVVVDVRNPLKAGMKIKRPNGEWYWLTFKYEKLPGFCFLCGIMGHNHKNCNLQTNVSNELLFGPWLRAPSRKQQQQLTIGNPWLRENKMDENWAVKNLYRGGLSSGQTEKAVNFQEGNSYGIVKGKGVIGEVSGEISVEGDKRDSGIPIIVQLAVMESGRDIGNDGVLVIDSKRRRVDEVGDDSQQFPMDADTTDIDGNLGLNSPKNGCPAGPGFQARHEP